MSDPLWSNVSLLLHFDGADGSTSFIDETGKTVTPQGDAQINGGGCLLDATGDFLIVSPGISFASGDFTAEYEVDFTESLAEIPVLCRRFGAIGYWLHSGYSGGNLRVVWQQWTSGGVYNFLEAVVAHTLNTKIAVCVERVGDVLTIYTNGVSRASDTFSNRPGSPGTTTEIGRDQDGTAATLNGRIYNLRVTNDAYRYGGNYTPATGPFPGETDPLIDGLLSGQLLPSGASAIQVSNPGPILADMSGQLLPSAASFISVFNPVEIDGLLSGRLAPSPSSRILASSFYSEPVYLTVVAGLEMVSLEIKPVSVDGRFDLSCVIDTTSRQSLVVDGSLRLVNDTPCGCVNG